MASVFELNLSPVYRLQGQEMKELPGLLALTPPKRAARGREEDSLLFYLTLSGNSRFTTTEYARMVDQTTACFYRTPGSLTSAIRMAAGELNQALLSRNLKTTAQGEYVVGRLIMGAIHGGQFVFARCGPASVCHLAGAETRLINDEQTAGRGLGIGQAVTLQFAQLELHLGDLLLLCPALPEAWEKALPGMKNLSAESLRRSLTSLTGDDLNAVLAQVQPGKGGLKLVEGLPTARERPPTSQPSASPVTAQPLPAQSGPVQSAPAHPASRVESSRPAGRFASLMGQAGGPAPTAPAPSTPSKRPETSPVVTISHPVRRSGRFVSPSSGTADAELHEIQRPVSQSRQKFFGGIARLIRGTHSGSKRVSEELGKFIPKLMPNPEDGQEVGRSSMALFAIVLPVIIVVVAVMVYFQYGRTAQYLTNYNQAITQASQARTLTNPTDVRHAWDSTIYFLDLADKSQKTQDSINLRQEAQTALDNLDGIMRLDFRPAIIAGLDRSVQISHLAATDTDLYMLDAARGSVMRATVTNDGYEVDTNFKCAPGTYGQVTVDTLIDIQALSMSNYYNASVLAMDGKGDLLYCGLADPVAAALVPPQLGWRSIAAFSLDADGKNLYVLDPAGSAVWQYTGSVGQFTDLPVLFFGAQVPQDMGATIDLAANGSDLYMLFQDGHVTSCPLTHYDVVPMRCADPVTFVDQRPERQNGPRISDAIFTQLTFASAPDPSLYLLEPLTRAIYRFSPRSDSLGLRGQFRATMEQTNTLFTGPATAMTISPNRYAFFSVGNQVYFATDVP